MRISKQDALAWFDFCSILSEDDELSAKQQEIAYGVFAQIEAAIDRRNEVLMSQIRDLKTLENRTNCVGPESKFAIGCRSCLLGKGWALSERLINATLSADSAATTDS